MPEIYVRVSGFPLSLTMQRIKRWKAGHFRNILLSLAPHDFDRRQAKRRLLKVVKNQPMDKINYAAEMARYKTPLGGLMIEN